MGDPGIAVELALENGFEPAELRRIAASIGVKVPKKIPRGKLIGRIIDGIEKHPDYRGS